MVGLVVPESWRTGLGNCFTHGSDYCIVIIGGLSTELGGLSTELSLACTLWLVRLGKGGKAAWPTLLKKVASVEIASKICTDLPFFKKKSALGKRSLEKRAPVKRATLAENGFFMKKVLNVGGYSKDIPLPAFYQGFEHILLDIDPKGSPDILCDARTLPKLEPNQFDAIFCSHNLEHYYPHEVPKVLSGFLHVLKSDGFAQIRVPDLNELMRTVVERNLDLEDILYQSAAGPIMVRDVLYGYSAEIERSGVDFFAHKTGFTQKSLTNALQRAGFANLFAKTGGLEVDALAFKGKPNPDQLSLFGLAPSH